MHALLRDDADHLLVSLEARTEKLTERGRSPSRALPTWGGLRRIMDKQSDAAKAHSGAGESTPKDVARPREVHRTLGRTG
jgi:hypothetical protein